MLLELDNEEIEVKLVNWDMYEFIKLPSILDPDLLSKIKFCWDSVLP